MKTERYRQLTFIPDGAHSFPQLPYLQGKCAWCRIKYLRVVVCLPGRILSKVQALRGIGKACGIGPQLLCPPHSFTFEMEVKTSHMTCLKVCKENKRLSCDWPPLLLLYLHYDQAQFAHKHWNHHCFQTSAVSSREIVQSMPSVISGMVLDSSQNASGDHDEIHVKSRVLLPFNQTECLTYCKLI